MLIYYLILYQGKEYVANSEDILGSIHDVILCVVPLTITEILNHLINNQNEYFIEVCKIGLFVEPELCKVGLAMPQLAAKHSWSGWQSIASGYGSRRMFIDSDVMVRGGCS